MNSQNLPNDINQSKQDPHEQAFINSPNSFPRPKIYKKPRPNFQNNVQSLQYSSNLEFTDIQNGQKLPESLMNVRPDLHNITPNRVSKNFEHSRMYAQRNNQNRRAQYQLAQQKPKKSILDAEVGEEGIALYKIWPGENRFFFKGRLMTGAKSDWIANGIVWGFMIAFCIVFFAVIFKYLTMDTTFLLPLISIYLYLATFGNMLLASFTDPGIIPRRQIWEMDGEIPPRFSGESKRNTQESIHLTNQSSRFDSFGRPSSVYCGICDIFRPTKARHCNLCGNCVEVYSHHSHILGNCIGKRNLKYYIALIASFVLLAVCYISSFLIIIIAVIGDDDDPNLAFRGTTATIVIIVILGAPSLLMLIVTLMFTFSGCYRRIRNKKGRKEEKEEDKKRLKESTNTGQWVNWWKNDPRLFDQRKVVTKEQFLNYKKSLSEPRIEV